MNSTRDMSKENFNVFFTLKNGDNMYADDMEMMIGEIGENFGIKKVYTAVNENYINLSKPDPSVITSIVVICLVAGYIISEVIAKYLLLSDVSVSKWLTALAIGLISIITVYVSLIKPMKVASKVSIVEAVKYNGESTTKKKTRKGYDYINVSRLTKANLSSNKKRTYVTLLSLTLSGILYIVVSCALSSMDAEKMAKLHSSHDIVIRLDNYTFGDKTSPNTELNILQKKNLLSDEFINELKKINGVKDVEVTSNMIKSEILNLELEEDFYDIIGIDESAENDLEDMELYLQDGEIDLEKLKSGEEMILNFSMYADMYDIKVGDILSFELYDGEDIIKKDFKIQAITDGPGVFVIHNNIMDKLVKTNTRHSIGLTIEKNAYNEVKAYVESLVKANENLNGSYIDVGIASSELAIKITKIMGYSLVVLIGVIGFINLINSMITSIITRKKELGMLQAIGLTNKQLVQMLNKEAMFYTSFMLIGSLTIGNIIGYSAVQAMRKSGMSYAVYVLPINQMIIMIVCIVLAQFILTYLISKNFNKESLIDRVRYSE